MYPNFQRGVYIVMKYFNYYTIYINYGYLIIAEDTGGRAQFIQQDLEIIAEGPGVMEDLTAEVKPLQEGNLLNLIIILIIENSNLHFIKINKLQVPTTPLQ